MALDNFDPAASAIQIQELLACTTWVIEMVYFYSFKTANNKNRFRSPSSGLHLAAGKNRSFCKSSVSGGQQLASPGTLGLFFELHDAQLGGIDTIILRHSPGSFQTSVYITTILQKTNHFFYFNSTLYLCEAGIINKSEFKDIEKLKYRTSTMAHVFNQRTKKREAGKSKLEASQVYRVSFRPNRNIQ